LAPGTSPKKREHVGEQTRATIPNADKELSSIYACSQSTSSDMLKRIERNNHSISDSTHDQWFWFGNVDGSSIDAFSALRRIDFPAE
jgi:hypothetical protein